MAITKLDNLVNPEVMGQMISATLPKKIKFAKLAKIDTTLVAQPGNTITVPKFAYIGDATDVAEGGEISTVVLTASTTQATVKKAGKGVEITDEAILSGYGDPVGEATSQLGMAIAAKVDNDCLDALSGATLTYGDGTAAISYVGVVGAVDLFEDESDTPTAKVMFVHPKQITQLRLDADFKDINKYPLQTVMTGVIGEICGVQIVPSKKVVKDVGGTYYINPIVVVDIADPNEATTADGNSAAAPALTIYMKKDVMTEGDRDITTKTNVITADQHYTAVLSNDSKVVVAKFKA